MCLNHHKAIPTPTPNPHPQSAGKLFTKLVPGVKQRRDHCGNNLKAHTHG